ncbi:MAG: N-acetyltransferase family protein [Amaricoccus sp.]|uniref:GNAT family N-acetyltransferase n=1 Tax=Amaricoccus sp. TaxID=1872485 RepID=UPI00331615D6
MSMIRPAEATDMAAIAEIYRHHVLTGVATFEEEPPAPEEMARRHAAVTGRGLPWLVAEAGGRLLGYAYAGPFHARSAYRFTLEDSVYLDPAATGRGLGTRLLDRLIVETTALGARQMVAVIGDSGNAASIALHARADFAHIGTSRSVGLKFGRWIDTVIMQRPLGAGDATLP